MFHRMRSRETHPFHSPWNWRYLPERGYILISWLTMFPEGAKMRTRLWVAVVMFILLAISTSFLGGYIAYRNYQLDTSGEISDICGYVIDEEGRPVRGVMVGLDEKTTFTNESGRFLMEEVNVGIITIEFYKAGYVPVEATRLVYPKEDIDGKLEDSVN
ncbi:MAG TPA: carboxypeptidase regulatory-like domain-containing protein, partial [Euryarchaeota archaeon]|nr:carboxypeptidase regulatory-like domain-containing protein [Euryarchaeota archaeon]